jgi:Ion channel.
MSGFLVFLIGMPVILGNLLLQSMISYWCLRFYLKRIDKVVCFISGVIPLFGVVTILMGGTLLQISLWALLFFQLGEFNSFQEAIYHSGVNFSTLGYGDIVMSSRWKMLGPLEAINGALMIGLSGANMLAVLQHQVKNRLGM